MARRTMEKDPWDGDDEWDGDEWDADEPSLEDLEADPELPTVPCPYCTRLLPEDVPRCPYCENYVSAEEAAAGRKPWWIIIGALLVLFVVYRWIVK
jgi:hypothetical protein